MQSRILKLTASLTLAVGCAAAQTSAEPLHATIVSEVHTLTATGPGAYEYEEVREVTVYDAAGAAWYNEVTVPYDGSSSVQALEGEVQSAGARKAERGRSKHERDYAAYDGTSIAQDVRMKVLSLPLPDAYPATYRTRTARRVREGVWMPLVDFRYPPGVAVEHAELRVTGVTGEVRTRVIDPTGLITTSEEGGTTRFSVSDLPVASDREDMAPDVVAAGPAVLLAPREGRLEGTAGDFTDWAGLGAWTAALLDERSDLPASATEEVRALVADTDDPLERIRRVYAYVQARTHYVSVQLGIGGFKPMPPAEVHAYGYGDCKALTNYTRLLLGAVDVDAYYCVIGVGERAIRYPSFASVNQANHAMLAVPMGADTVWLECTSQTTPAGFIGDAAAGRYALLVKDGSGSLVRTSGGATTDNLRTSTATLTLGANGDVDLERVTHSRGTELADAYRLSVLGGEERRQYARAGFSGSVEGLDPRVTIRQTPGGPVATVVEAARLPHLARRAGKLLAVPAFGYLPAVETPRDTAGRRLPVEITGGYRRVDTVRYLLPEGTELLGAPESVSLDAPHARYRLTAAAIDGGVLAVRELEVRAGIYPATEAAAMARFARAVTRADAGVLAAGPQSKSTPDDISHH